MIKNLSVKYETIEGTTITTLTITDNETGYGKVFVGTEAEELYKKLTEDDK